MYHCLSFLPYLLVKWPRRHTAIAALRAPQENPPSAPAVAPAAADTSEAAILTYTALPGYVAGFDVCTIPFLRSPLTEATNPVKLFEYLATGKPIVARRLPELEPYESVVSLYDEPEEFVTQVVHALGVTATRRSSSVAM